MREFTTSRLSKGNNIIPNKVRIDQHGVTLRVPGLFSQEKTLLYRQISSVKIEIPLIGFSTIIFDTIGFDQIEVSGFTQEEVKEMRELVQHGISGSQHNSQLSSSHNYPGLNQSQVGSISQEQQNEKLRLELEKQKQDEEMSLKRRQQELEEQKHKQERINKLRSEGKNIQVFFLQYGIYVGLGIVVLSMVLFFMYLSYKDKSIEEESTEINLRLEQIEDQLKISIQSRDQEKSLELVNQLVHPIHEQWKDQSKFDGWNGYPYYDEWWSKKRENYKKEIMNMVPESEKNTPSKTLPETIDEEPVESIEKEEVEDETNTTSSLIGEYIGSQGNIEFGLGINKINEDNSVEGYYGSVEGVFPLGGTVTTKNKLPEFNLKTIDKNSPEREFTFTIEDRKMKGKMRVGNSTFDLRGTR